MINYGKYLKKDMSSNSTPWPVPRRIKAANDGSHYLIVYHDIATLRKLYLVISKLHWMKEMN
jgi:hypothetical protein